MEDFDGPDLVRSAEARFESCRSSLAQAPPWRTRGAMGAAASIIRRYASRPWALMTNSESRCYCLSTIQECLIVGAVPFGRVLADILSQLETTRDPRVREIFLALGDRETRRNIALDLFMALFLSHELFHIDQQLGSDQYRDSDGYMSVVASVDYQADLAAIAYVSRAGIANERIGTRELLVLLMAIHIFAIYAFLEKGTLSYADFDRLLTWHFQFARAVRSEGAPDILHPGLQYRPTIEIPGLRELDQGPLTLGDFTRSRNANSVTRQDLVVAASDGNGLLRVWRMTFTDEARLARLTQAVFDRDLASVRGELEEFFLVHSAAMDFARTESAFLALEALVAKGSRLIEAGEEGILGPDSQDLVEFLQESRMLLDQIPRGRLPAPLAKYVERWRGGVHKDLSKTLIIRFGLDWRKRAKREISSELTTEVSRLTVRLSTLRDNYAPVP